MFKLFKRFNIGRVPFQKKELSYIEEIANNRIFNNVIIVDEDGKTFQTIKTGNVTITKQIDIKIINKEEDMSKKLDAFIKKFKLDPAKKDEIGKELTKYKGIDDLERGVEKVQEKFSVETKPATPAQEPEDAFGFLEEFKEQTKPASTPAKVVEETKTIDPDTVAGEILKAQNEE